MDTAGMGKTTLLKYLFLDCVLKEAGIPIFIELRKLSKKRSILDFILEELSDVEGKSKPDLFFKLLSSGDFVFFMDGYDEIPEAERAEVTAAIQQFIQKTPANKFILTSRDEASLVAFSQFQRYTIRPLEKDEAYSLLRKYSVDGLAETLIEKIELPENRAIHEFLTNPLLTSLLFKSFEYKHIIPLKRHIFYRQVYESLYETHDLTKEGGQYHRDKRSGLDIDRLENILRALGAITYRAGETEFSKDMALEFIKTAKKLSSEAKPSPSDILDDITRAVPLLIIEGNYVRWSHRSIQEYFAAQYICKNTELQKKYNILLQLFGGSDAVRHWNLIALCCDIDKPSFDQSIGRKIATELLSQFNNSYANFDESISPALLQERKELTVGRHSFFVRYNPRIASRTEEAMNEERKVNQALSRRMQDESGESVFYGTGLGRSSDDQGIGRVSTRIDFFITNAGNSINLPFIHKRMLPYQPLNNFLPKSTVF